MEKIRILWLLILTTTALFAGPRDAQWKKVDDAIGKGLPKTAIEELEPIIRGAMVDKAFGEAVKAIGRRIVLEGNIQGNKPEEKIIRLEAEIAKVLSRSQKPGTDPEWNRGAKEIIPLLDALLANWYWQYFCNNRWRFLQRTATVQAPGKDFTTWDLTRLFAEIDHQFAQALASADKLKTISIATYDDLLEKGALPDAYRPTLYDFLAHEALQFYTSGEQAAAKPQDAFEVSAESDGLAPVERFLAWKPETTDTDSPVLKAIHLYRDLLRFHQKDHDPTAFLDADLSRLVYVKNVAFGEKKDARFKSAMEALAKKYGDHELASMALFHVAQTLQSEGYLAEAHAVANGGAMLHRKSNGGILCNNLVREIEQKSAAISTERVWNAPFPKIQVRYRNVTRVYFRAVAWDWNTVLQRNHYLPPNLSQEDQEALLKKAPVLEWSHELSPAKDFKVHVAEFAAPEKLEKGFYFIIASHDPKFSESNNQISFADVWISDLALITRPNHGRIEGFVLQANSGEPIAGAEIEVWHLNNQGTRVADLPVRTDENGFFAFQPVKQSGYLLRARHKGEELAAIGDCYSGRENQPQPYEHSVFFTDRGIYRPGQTIQYKGICVHVDQPQDNYRVLPNRELTVVFTDPNGKEIERQKRQTNDYGSFSGSFTAPRDRLMGQMQIYVQGGPLGQGYFRVEEYKRPKFQVTLDAPKTAGKLNESVSLQGHAMGYSGAAVDGASVKYRIVRQVRMPWWWGWCCWRFPPFHGQNQEIAHGMAKTETDGSFKIDFRALADPAVPEKSEPTFVYQIHSDVTDSAGETRSGDRSIYLGYTALQAIMNDKEWQTEDEAVVVNLNTQTLDGEPQKADCSVKIHQIEAPSRVQRPSLMPPSYDANDSEASSELRNPQSEIRNQNDPNTWPLGKVIAEQGVTTDKEGKALLRFKLKTGLYRAVLETQDRFGKKVTGLLPIQVLKPSDHRLDIKIPHLLATPADSVEPGQEFMALWGTGYEAGRAFIEIEHRHKMLQRYWTQSDHTQETIKQAVTEAMRGGFTLHLTQVRENRAYLASRHIDVPWTNKELHVKWEHFTSKLQPNQKDTWTAVITGKNAQKSVADLSTIAASYAKAVAKDEVAKAEMVAALYDESLDAFVPHNWMRGFAGFRQDYSSAQPNFGNVAQTFRWIKGSWNEGSESVTMTYRTFPADLVQNLWGYAWMGGGRGRMMAPSMKAMNAAPAAPMAEGALQESQVAMDKIQSSGEMREEKAKDGGHLGVQGQPASKGPDLSQVAARKNLNETAFFFPHLVSEKEGVVRMTFTMPEALTQWKFLGFAHDRDLRSGFLDGTVVTQKDLMVQPNPPRLLREGDVLEFTVKVSNLTDILQKGKVQLTLNDALTDKSADQALGNGTPAQSFEIPAKESRSYSWKLTAPDSLSMLTYKAVAASEKVSDGEEGIFPVLSRRILVTESLPLPIRGPSEKKFTFRKLLDSGKSTTLQHKNLTMQMVSNPSWYAVMALPYLMEFPHECSEQTFNRLYANALARTIANSDPKIHRIFEQWRGTKALDSPLEKNQDLKSVVLEETPWVRQAESESQSRRNVGILFDDNRLNNETERCLQKLSEMQLADGAWPWFPGGRGDDFITLYITTGFGRLRHLGVDMRVDPALRSLNRLDDWINTIYRDILRNGNQEDNHLSSTIALYLYGRSFFLKDQPVGAGAREAVDYFLAQARKFWLQLDCRQSQGHLAIALFRFGDQPTATGIMKSIKERSVSDEELGMFWRDTELSWWWYRAPIETQALMIEAFDEVMHDDKAVEDCKVWLLKQKQTRDWKTTKATADAVYALLLKGDKNLASDALVEVSLGGQTIKPENVEAGTGFYEKKFSGSEIKPALGEITVKKTDPGVAWGSIHWQYLEDMTKVTPYEGTPLKLKKSIFTKKPTKKGPVLEEVKGPLEVGDELVVRIELRVDRDMEYVHMKDQRGSGLEPLNVISQYKFQDGLAYYESTRDTASHFFINYMPKGTYVFEYSTRVIHRGSYQTGIAGIQCMYAPEFGGHSESLLLTVK